jgi:class 3 adenylate cyclase
VASSLRLVLGHCIQLRAGLHTGEVELRGDDVGGIAIHVAARVMAAAGQGEILVSRTVRDLVAGSDVTLEDRGMYLVKGIEGDWQLLSGLPEVLHVTLGQPG